MLESYIKNTNLVALKIFMYVAKSDKVDVELLHSLRDEQIVETRLSIKDMLNYCNISSQTLNRNLKKMTETSIRIANEKGSGYMNLLPYCMANYNGYLDVQIFAGILKLTHALEAYSLVDASTFASLTKAHSIRMLMLLNRINNFGTNIAKRKRYTLKELNEMFDTNYKTIPEFNRAVLKPAKEELDEKSKLTFLYEQRKDKLERTVGRAKVVEVIIDLIERKNYQPSLI
jgi:plasmid replication initiation protein